MPPKANSPLRQLSVLANLLKPILGEQADARSDDLLSRYGSIAAIMSASRESLYTALDGNGEVAEALLAARSLAAAGWREEIAGQPVDPADPQLAQYLLTRLQNAHEERLHAIFLDLDDHYIRDEQIGAGNRSSLSLRMRTIIQRAFDLEAHKVILAHNHPSGRAVASDLDRQATARFEGIARALEIELVDHLIVAAGRAYSMRRGQQIW